MKLEGQLTRELVRELRKELPNSVVFKHADRITYGIPDISITWLGSTTWLEVKRGGINGRLIQNQVMDNLSLQGNAFYVVYMNSGIQILEISKNFRCYHTYKTHSDIAAFVRSRHVEIHHILSEYRNAKIKA